MVNNVIFSTLNTTGVHLTPMDREKVNKGYLLLLYWIVHCTQFNFYKVIIPSQTELKSLSDWSAIDIY